MRFSIQKSLKAFSRRAATHAFTGVMAPLSSAIFCTSANYNLFRHRNNRTPSHRLFHPSHQNSPTLGRRMRGRNPPRRCARIPRLHESTSRASGEPCQILRKSNPSNTRGCRRLNRETRVCARKFLPAKFGLCHGCLPTGGLDYGA